MPNVQGSIKTLQRGLLAAAIGLIATLAAPRAGAGLGDPLFATGGNVTIRFEGADAGFDSVLSVNGSPEIFPNHTTPVGTTIDLGSFAAGTPLDLVLHVLDTGNFFHSGPGTNNIDGLAHALVTNVIGRTFVSFEETLGGGDRDFNDMMVSLTNVQGVAAVPEPVSLALFGIGLAGLGFARRKQ
jgi:hypothetical protein